MSRVNVFKLFLVHTQWCVCGRGRGGQARASFSRLCLIFANKAGPTYSGASNFMGKLLDLSTNICIIVQSLKNGGNEQSSLFCPNVGDEEKRFKTLTTAAPRKHAPSSSSSPPTRCQPHKTFTRVIYSRGKIS